MFFQPPPKNNTNTKSFYDILEIPQTANETDIKTAYRKLSFKYHPDRNKNPNAQIMFQEISNAYETLSDPEKKRNYDLEQLGGGIDLINMMFGGGGPSNFTRVGPRIHVFTRMDGSRSPGMEDFIRIHHPPHRQKPERIEKCVNITIEQAYNGCNIPIEIERLNICGDEKIKEIETIYVNILQGIDTNETITILDKGHVINDVIKGDVRLIIQVNNHSSFQRNGLELMYKKTISLKEALLGFSFDLQHLNGKTFTFSNISQIIHPNFKRRIPDLGMIRENNCGSLWIEFNIQFPETLTEQQTLSLKEIL